MKVARGWGLKKVREQLGLAVWEVELAVEAGLLRRLSDRTYDPVSVNAALADPDHFRQLLAAEHRCNATQAAARLGISAERFKRIAADLTPIAVEEIRKYGRTLIVRYYRAADVDALADQARADTELRAAARALSRSEAAKKAAQTRKRNLEQARSARLAIDATMPAPETDPVQVLIWSAALMAAAGTWPGPLRRLRFIADPRVPSLIEGLREARLSRTELEAMLGALLPRAAELIPLLVPPSAVEQDLGVPVELMPEILPRFGDHLLASDLRALLAAPPPWLLQARADEELRQAAHAEIARAAAAEQAAVDAAVRATSRLSDDTVAEIFGLPVDVIRPLRPKSGRWSAEHVAALLRRTPAWLRTESAARAEAERRRRNAEHRAARLAERRLSWRRQWAKAFGVPLDQVPKTIGRPTPKAINAARRHPPPWTHSTRSY